MYETDTELTGQEGMGETIEISELLMGLADTQIYCLLIIQYLVHTNENVKYPQIKGS